MSDIIAVVVTFNRKKLLIQAIDLLLLQTFPLKKILIIDNNSDDGTGEIVKQKYYQYPSVIYVRLNENFGGAGGFHAGVKYAYENGYEWLWLMDDDAEPAENALENLMKYASDNLTIYGSTAIQENQLCWPVGIDNKQTVTQLNELPPVASTMGVPFLGFLIHRDLVKLIGYPDKDFFISGDDMEYCQRARKIGKEIKIVRDSHIFHPLPPRITFKFFNHRFFFLKLTPWRRYYDVRNRVVLAKRHYGFKLYAATLPGIFARWLLTLFVDNNRLEQSTAYFRGIKDGLAGKLGRTW